MRYDRLGICLSAVLMLNSLAGCSKKEASPAPVTPAPQAATPVPSATPSVPIAAIAPAVAPAAAVAPVAVEKIPAWTKTDSALQQRILAIGAKHQQAQARGELTRDQMQKIGFAFNEFNEINSAYPAINGVVKPGTAPSGLSWRVALLPYLDELKLYHEFHLNEPWDSPHNKTLIGRMPQIFGKLPEGKTRLHLLTGRGAPFRMNEMLREREVRDGVGDTLLAVVGGPDTAEVWTKPTALPFNPQQPMKCLGNVSEKFWVVTAIGVCSNLSATGSPEAFGLLVTHNEGRRAGDAAWNAMGVRGPNQTMERPETLEIKINQPTTPLAKESPQHEWNGIPDDAFVAIVAQPRRILDNPVIKVLVPQFAPLIYRAIAPGGPRRTQFDIDQYEQQRRGLGIALENVDEVVVVLDKSWPADFNQDPQTQLAWGLILKNSVPFDLETILAVIGKTEAPNRSYEGDFFHGISIKEHEGIAIIQTVNQAPAVTRIDQFVDVVELGAEPAAMGPATKGAIPMGSSKKSVKSSGGVSPPNGSREPDSLPLPIVSSNNETLAVAYLSDSVMLLGTEAVVRKMISARSSSGANTELKKALESAGKSSFVMAADFQPVEQSFRDLATNAWSSMAPLAAPLTALRGLRLECDFDAPEMLKLTVELKTPELTRTVSAGVEQSYKAVQEQYPLSRPKLTQDTGTAMLLPYFDQLAAETKLTSTDRSISLIVPQLKNPKGLVEALGPIAAQLQQSGADRLDGGDPLKQVGSAMWNLGESLEHYPALNGLGEKSQPNPGLSWRVYLLPGLDQRELFSKFNLKQPWDSPQNKPLIKLMPKIFGSNPDGKTSIHVFTGPGAPFAMNKGLAKKEIKDGASRTILVIEAGPDTADYWTKPGGLKFDRANPSQCLGAIKEFRAVFFDGSVRRIKNPNDAALRKLIQHADEEK